MQLLKKVNDQISLQILCDLLGSGGISYRVEGAGMNSLLPLPGLIEARVLVDEQDMAAAQSVLAEMEKGVGKDTEEGQPDV
jgi:Putative prokaryotic signal transducing protein